MFALRHSAALCVVLSAISGCALTDSRLSASDVPQRHVEHRTMLSNPNSRGYVRIPLLEEYLSGVAKTLIAQAEPSALAQVPVRIYISATGDVGADTFRDGAIYIRWGTFAALESEDQVAALLAHEISHVLRNHIQQNDTFSSLVKPLSTITMLASTGTPAGLLVSVLGGQYLDKAGLAAWSQKEELEADAQGLALLMRAGYDGDAFFALFDAFNPRIVDAPSVRENLKSTGKSGQYELEIGNLRFGSAERSHPDLWERREKIQKLLDANRRLQPRPKSTTDPFLRVKNMPEVRAALRGIEAASNAERAFEKRNIAQAQREMVVADNSPVRDASIVQLTRLNVLTHNLTAGLYALKLDGVAEQSNSPIRLSITELIIADSAKDWATATRIADRIIDRYDERPEVYPLIAKAYRKRIEQIKARTFPGSGLLIIPVRGQEAEFAEYKRLNELLLRISLRCVKTGDMNIIAGCSRAS